MARRANRRSRRGRARRPGRSRSSRKSARRTRRTPANRRIKPGEASEGREVNPTDRRIRNRTLLLIGLLVFVNLYVFAWREEALSFSMEAAAIAEGPTGVADPPVEACSADPVRIFDGLEDQLRLETRLSEGKTLRLGLLELGVSPPEIGSVEAAVRGHVALELLTGSGAPLVVALDRYGGVQALEIELAEGHLVQACRAKTGLEVRNIQHPLRTDVEVLAFELPLNGDLVRAVRDADEKPELARIIASTLAPDVDFPIESRPGDRVQLIVEKRYLGRSFHRYANVLAIRYRGAAGYFAHYYYKPKRGEAAYFDGDGQPTKRELLRSPVAWYPYNPELKASMPATIEFVDGKVGAVYRRGEGAPVIAIADGEVASVRNREDTGLTVELRLEDGRIARYEHLMRFIGELEVGQKLAQGTVFALVGHTGKTPGDRLRLEILEEREGELEHVDPVMLTAKGEERAGRMGDAIPKKQLDRFLRDIRPWRRAMRQAAR